MNAQWGPLALAIKYDKRHEQRTCLFVGRSATIPRESFPASCPPNDPNGYVPCSRPFDCISFVKLSSSARNSGSLMTFFIILPTMGSEKAAAISKETFPSRRGVISSPWKSGVSISAIKFTDNLSQRLRQRECATLR